MADPDLALSVESLYAGYGKVSVLHDVSLDVRAGESVALLGPNNAGKSTLLRCLSGLIPARAGRCTLFGRDLAGDSPAARVAAGIIHVPEGRHVFADLTVEDNLRVGASRLPKRRRAEQLDKVYGQLPSLTGYRRKPAGLLSGGQQQMVAIGRALAAEPRLLLVDEPSLGLSPVAVDEVIDTLRALQANQHLTMLVVEQSALLAMELCGRGYVLRDGGIAVAGDASTLRGDLVQDAYLA